MKAASSLIAAGIIILLLYPMILAIDQFRLKDQIDPFNVTTAAAVTSANVTLSQDLYNDATSGVSIESDLDTDAPVASTYTAATNYLLVTGLTADDSRQLTITYDIDRLSDYYGAQAGARVLPILIILGVICIVAGASYQTFRRGD